MKSFSLTQYYIELRLPNSTHASVVTGGGFIRGTKFRYSGRTEREILTESLNALRQQHLLNNTSPSKRKANSVPATPSSPQGDMAELRTFFFYSFHLIQNRSSYIKCNYSIRF